MGKKTEIDNIVSSLADGTKISIHKKDEVDIRWLEFSAEEGFVVKSVCPKRKDLGLGDCVCQFHNPEWSKSLSESQVFSLLAKREGFKPEPEIETKDSRQKLADLRDLVKAIRE